MMRDRFAYHRNAMTADYPVIRHALGVAREENPEERLLTFETLTEQETGDQRFFVNRQEVPREWFFAPWEAEGVRVTPFPLSDFTMQGLAEDYPDAEPHANWTLEWEHTASPTSETRP